MRRLLLAPLALVLAMPALAGSVPRFGAVDRDGDALIRPNEAYGHPAVAEHFSELDLDDSGGLSPREYAEIAVFEEDAEKDTGLQPIGRGPASLSTGSNRPTEARRRD